MTRGINGALGRAMIDHLSETLIPPFDGEQINAADLPNVTALYAVAWTDGIFAPDLWFGQINVTLQENNGAVHTHVAWRCNYAHKRSDLALSCAETALANYRQQRRLFENRWGDSIVNVPGDSGGCQGHAPGTDPEGLTGRPLIEVLAEDVEDDAEAAAEAPGAEVAGAGATTDPARSVPDDGRAADGGAWATVPAEAPPPTGSEAGREGDDRH